MALLPSDVKMSPTFSSSNTAPRCDVVFRRRCWRVADNNVNVLLCCDVDVTATAAVCCRPASILWRRRFRVFPPWRLGSVYVVIIFSAVTLGFFSSFTAPLLPVVRVRVGYRMEASMSMITSRYVRISKILQGLLSGLLPSADWSFIIITCHISMVRPIQHASMHSGCLHPVQTPRYPHIS